MCLINHTYILYLVLHRCKKVVVPILENTGLWRGSGCLGVEKTSCKMVPRTDQGPSQPVFLRTQSFSPVMGLDRKTPERQKHGWVHEACRIED